MTSNEIIPIDPFEPLTRYIFSRKYFKGEEVLHGAFLPNNGEVSVFRCTEWSESEVWENGLEIGKHRVPTLKGRGDFKWESLKKIVVKIYPDLPPSKHANIKDFPDKREEIQEQATILAKASKFKKYTPSF